jgi:hypothetical protein
MSDIKGLREISNDPFGKLLTALSKKFSAFLAKDQAELVENPEDIYADGQDVESALKYHNFVMAKKFPISPTNVEYYSTFEPDSDKLRLWLIGRSLGTFLRDYSEEERIASLHGDSILIDGTPFDWGIAESSGGDTKSIALRMNRPTSELEGEDYITVTHDARIRVSEALSTGISFFIRFRIFDLAQQNGYQRTLFEKTDNSPITDGVEINIDSAGRLKFHIENSNVQYNKETAFGTIAINTVYDCWFTYTKAGNVQHIYVNNVDKTLTNTDNAVFHPDTSNLDATVFSVGAGVAAGSVYGDLYDFRIYREKVVSATEVSQMWANKWTISDIAFGQVAISNYSATSGVSVTVGSFTSTSFTSTSFTT